MTTGSRHVDGPPRVLRPRIRVGTTGEELLHHLPPPVLRRHVQRRRGRLVQRPRHPVRRLRQELANRGEVAALGRRPHPLLPPRRRQVVGEEARRARRPGGSRQGGGGGRRGALAAGLDVTGCPSIGRHGARGGKAAGKKTRQARSRPVHTPDETDFGRRWIRLRCTVMQRPPRPARDHCNPDADARVVQTTSSNRSRRQRREMGGEQQNAANDQARNHRAALANTRGRCPTRVRADSVGAVAVASNASGRAAADRRVAYEHTCASPHAARWAEKKRVPPGEEMGRRSSARLAAPPRAHPTTPPLPGGWNGWRARANCQAAFALGGRVAGTPRAPRYSSVAGVAWWRFQAGGAGGPWPSVCNSGRGGRTVSSSPGVPPPAGHPSHRRTIGRAPPAVSHVCIARGVDLQRGRRRGPPAPVAAPGGTHRQQLATSRGSWRTQRRLARLPPRQPMAGGGRIGEPMELAWLGQGAFPSSGPRHKVGWEAGPVHGEAVQRASHH